MVIMGGQLYWAPIALRWPPHGKCSVCGLLQAANTSNHGCQHRATPEPDPAEKKVQPAIQPGAIATQRSINRTPP